MNKSPDYNYYKSQILDLEYAIHKDKNKDKRVHFSDKVIYEWEEIKQLQGLPPEKIILIHKIKFENKDKNLNFSEILTLAEAAYLEEYLSVIANIFDGEIKTD